MRKPLRRLRTLRYAGGPYVVDLPSIAVFLNAERPESKFLSVDAGAWTREPCEDVDPMPDYENVLTD